MKLNNDELNLLIDACQHRSEYTQECLWECEDDGREKGAQKNRDRLKALNALESKLAKALT